MANYKKPLKKDTGPKAVCQNKKCLSMGRFLSIDNFAKSRNPLLPHCPYCNDCANKMINPNELDTIYSLLKTLNYPFDANVWNETLQTYKENYLTNYLDLIDNKYDNEFHGKTWDDSNFLVKKDTELNENFEDSLMDEKVWDDEWYGYYTRRDLIYLNNYLSKLKQDYSIVTANHLDYARKVAQASLAMTKAFNDMQEGKQDADKMYNAASANFDKLCKSAEFAQSQRSATDISLGSFGQIFDKVEKSTYVPQYVPDEEDIYDKLISQFSNLNKSL